jgi:AcrR family transcriptional regulator
MATKKAKAPETGRKSAYVARNREAILKAALTVFARDGAQATMDDVSAEAQMAMSTVYKHFKDKHDLIASVTLHAFNDWEAWMQQQLPEVSDPLEQFVLPMRYFLRAKNTHPEYAQLVAKNFGVISQILPTYLTYLTQLSAQATTLVKAKLLTPENLNVAIQNLIAVLVLQLVNQVTNPKSTTADADAAVKVGLLMLGISEAKAKKLTESKITL